MFILLPRKLRPKVYCFCGVEKSDWYYKEYLISCIAIGWNKEEKQFYFNFVCDRAEFVSVFIILSLKQMLILPFKHRLYFSKKRAKARQSLNWKRMESDNNAEI